MNSWIPLTCVPTSNYVSFKPCFQIHLFMSKEFKELKCDDFKGQSLENIYHSFSLLLLLSCFSPVWLCATPETAAHQAPLSLGFSRQEHWSGLPFPSPMQESEKWKWSRLVVSDSSRPHGLQPTRLLHPWDFPGKSTGVGCHCLLWVCSLEEGKCQAPRRDNYWWY